MLDESHSKSFCDLIEGKVKQDATDEQDTQVIKFLNGRKQLIELDSEFTKTSLDIASFKNYED